MRKMILGAGALLLSSTAFAGTVHAASVNDPFTAASAAYANHAHPTAQTAWMGNSAAAKDLWSDKSVSSLYGAFEGAMSYEEASAFTGDKNEALTATQVSEKQSWLAQSDATDDTQMAAGKGKMDGQGGPFEAADADSERTAWPACRPGPGDDRCIQLHEPGVRRAYAQWSAGRARMGMGGPEEPVTAKADTATGPTTEPTGVRVDKAAMEMGMDVDAGAVSKKADKA